MISPYAHFLEAVDPFVVVVQHALQLSDPIPKVYGGFLQGFTELRHAREVLAHRRCTADSLNARIAQASDLFGEEKVLSLFLGRHVRKWLQLSEGAKPAV